MEWKPKYGVQHKILEVDPKMCLTFYQFTILGSVVDTAKFYHNEDTLFKTGIELLK